MSTAEHRALVVATPTAERLQTSGATLRLQDVLSALATTGFVAQQITGRELAGSSGRWCLGVAVSYASAGHLPALRQRCPTLWLDAMDSWLLVNATGLRSGHASYAARAVRDAWRLTRMPVPDLATWITSSDLAADRRTVRAHRRLVLPASIQPPAPRLAPAAGRRIVLVADWAYAPNRHGLSWFRRRVLPRLTPALEELDAVVEVCGSAAPTQPQHPRVRVRGYVTDVADLYRVGDVHAAPVLFGGGVKRKVLQPLLAGLPVVTTTPGAHGLRPQALLDVRDDPGEFAAALADRLAMPALPRYDPGQVLHDEGSAALTWLRHRAATCQH